MPELRDLSRRSVLAVGAVGVGGAALAACGSSGGDSGGQPPAPASAPATGGGSAAPLAKLSDITVGQTVSATSPDGKPLIVARPTATTAVAFSAICTHQGCTVKPAGGHIECPCHHSTYNNLTGVNTGGPAPAPLASYPVKVQGDEVLPA